MCIRDRHHSLEMLPGSYRRYGSEIYVNAIDTTLMPWKGIRDAFSASTDDDIFVRIFDYFTAIVTMIILLLPALCYRWSLRGSALIFSPLVWIAYGATARSARDHLRDIHEVAFYRVARRFAALVLLLFICKTVIHYSWNDLPASWRSVLALKLLEPILAPAAFPPWQLAGAVNALLAWVIYFASDWVLARWKRNSRINERAVETRTPLAVAPSRHPLRLHH